MVLVLLAESFREGADTVIREAFSMVGWFGYVLIGLTALCLTVPVCFLWERWDDRRLARDSAAWDAYQRRATR